MDEILRHLPAGARVLDLGSKTGSFPGEACPGAVVVRLDCDPLVASPGAEFVQADAACLPFRTASFNAVIANHSLEHIVELAAALAELGRVIKPGGALYVSAPDSSTFSDRLYRWVFRGGGHVNPFVSPSELSDSIARATGLPHVATRELVSSFGFLDRSHFPPRFPRRLLLVCNGNRGFLRALSYVTRVLDRVFRTRLSRYGWAMYFGAIREPIDTAVRTNVCGVCGGAAPAGWLTRHGCVRRWTSTCPICGAPNFFTPDA